MFTSAPFYTVIVFFAVTNADIFNTEKFQNYSTILNFIPKESNSEILQGILNDCHKKITFSCIQKNAYSYLEQTFMNHDNITVFDGLNLIRNKLDYDECIKDDSNYKSVDEVNNIHENKTFEQILNEKKPEVHSRTEHTEEDENEYLTPLEKITHAMRKKTVRFLVTRDYQIQLPAFIGQGFSLKISPRMIDDNGALIRVDFNNVEMENKDKGRLLFKKLKKQLQNKLLLILVVLILLIKIVKLKFMFVIPFLFGIGTAKKLFLKLLLFFVPAFAHVFKLCSSYYSNQATKYHHHHHKIAHHHHHIPVPLPVSYTKPVYYDHPPSHSHILEDDFPGFDYAHPHLQYRKDIEELKEWGIEPYDSSYDQIASQSGVVYPGPTISTNKHLMHKFPNPYNVPNINIKPINSVGSLDKVPPLHLHSQNLAYSGYGSQVPLSKISNDKQLFQPNGITTSSIFEFVKPSVAQSSKQHIFNNPNDVSIFQHHTRPVHSQYKQDLQQKLTIPEIPVPSSVSPVDKLYDDDFYGPIIEKLDEIFNQMKYLEDSCRERLICSMYKNPTFYSPHSNIISHELSRDPQELQRINSASSSSERFIRYLNAARLGQDGGDCLKSFHCSSNIK